MFVSGQRLICKKPETEIDGIYGEFAVSSLFSYFNFLEIFSTHLYDCMYCGKED